jgi:outer membrane protein OmpA-like peptidoglycan-associated protein
MNFPSHFSSLARRALTVAAALALAGCGNLPPIFPWHDAPASPADPAPPPAHAEPPPAPETPPKPSEPPLPPIDWDALQGELAAELKDIDGFHLTHLPRGLRLILPAADGFASSSAQVEPRLARLLERIVPALRRNPRLTLHIVGHTDSQGSEMYNLRLSIARAEAMMEHLRAQGIDLARLSADGKGEAEPIADNAQESGRARNRRVELFLDLRQ